MKKITVLVSGAVVTCMVLLITSTAWATTFTVTNTADSGEGSLRNAISDANANAGADVIEFADGLAGTITLASSLPVATDAAGLSITGGGNVTLKGPSLVSDGRSLQVGDGGELTLKNLTIANGGGIANHGTLRVASSTLSNNVKPLGDPDGGGIYNAGTLEVTDSILSGNGTSSAPVASGGGIYNGVGATATVTDSTLSGNSSSADGLGGGGIYNAGTLKVINSTLSDNLGEHGHGGGIYNRGTLEVTGSTVSGNNSYHGGGIANEDRAAVDRSTFTGNYANRTDGGGILNRGTLKVINSTLSGNGVGYPGATGGGIANHGTLELTNSTLSGNSAYQGVGGIAGIGTATLRSTIVANSDSGVITEDGYSVSDTNCQGAVTDGGYNVEDANTCGFTDATSQSNANPLLGPLQDNGGPTQTHALGAGSPAIDKGNSFGSTTDQRGEPRPFDFDDAQFPDATGGDGSDIGAFELQGSTYDFAGFFHPVDNPPTNNEVKARRAIPVEFSLGGDQGLDIFESGYPKSVEMPCDSTASVDAIEQTLRDNSSHLTYDATTDTYTYVWKTDKAWADTCRQLVVKLNDGSTEHVANFTFVK